MRTALLISTILVVVAVVLSACQSGQEDPEKYRKSHDRYMGSYEPKSGGPDL